MTSDGAIVLVVDDDFAVRDSLKFALELEGLAVCVFAGGAALLAHPGLSEAGCILLDCKMPEMDGFLVLAALAAQGVQVPVIMMTAGPTARLRQRAAGAGVRHVLDKPLFNGRLMEAISDVLGNPLRVFP